MTRMDDLTPAEQAAVDRFDAATRDLMTSVQNFTLAAMGASKRLDEFGRQVLEQEQREFTAIAERY
jgi:hypothetical protein